MASFGTASPVQGTESSWAVTSVPMPWQAVLLESPEVSEGPGLQRVPHRPWVSRLVPHAQPGAFGCLNPHQAPVVSERSPPSQPWAYLCSPHQLPPTPLTTSLSPARAAGAPSGLPVPPSSSDQPAAPGATDRNKSPSLQPAHTLPQDTASCEQTTEHTPGLSKETCNLKAFNPISRAEHPQYLWEVMTKPSLLSK